MRFILFIGLAVLSSPIAARADCTNPQGVASQTVYDTSANIVKFCDGVDWHGMKSFWSGNAGAITYAGNVGVGSAAIVPSAALEVGSTAKGFLPPRLTTAQRDAIASPAAGLIVFNLTTGTLNVYAGGWRAFSEPRVCESEYTQFGGHCYKLSASTATQSAAQAACVAAGGYLARVSDLQENTFVAGLLSLSSGFVDGADIATEGMWVYGDGMPVTYFNWRSGEPNNAGSNEDCVQIVKSDARWNDIDCAWDGSYICEKD